MSFDYAVNNQIRTREVRLVSDSGDQQVMSTYEALQQAQSQGLDLVEINSKSVPPICKILDYGRFKYEQVRKQKELDKKNRESRIELKEIQLRATTDDNDIQIKAKRAQGFLNDGDKVKVVLRFKGREITHTEVGRRVMETFLSGLVDFKFERPVCMSERQLFAILSPAPKKAN